MTSFGLRFHHLGLAVVAWDKAAIFLRGLGYAVLEPIYDPLQNVWLAWCEADGLPSVELVAPAGEDGPLQGYLKRQETMIYHTCYLAPNPPESLKAMSAAALVVREMAPAKPAILFGGALVSFHYVSGFGLIELIHQAEAVVPHGDFRNG